MPVCSAFGCKQHAKEKGISLHVFPKDPIRRQQWVDALGRKDFVPSDRAVLCTRHFDEKDVDRTSAVCIRLRENAVPTVFPASPSNLKVNKKHRKPPREPKAPPLKKCDGKSFAPSDLPSEETRNSEVLQACKPTTSNTAMIEENGNETQVQQIDQEQSDTPRESSVKRHMDESKQRRNETQVHQIDQEQSDTPRESSLERQLEESKQRQNETRVHQIDQEQSDTPRESSLERQLDESKQRRNETQVHQIDQEQSDTPRESSLKRQLDESKQRRNETQVHQIDQEQSDTPRESSLKRLKRHLDLSKQRRNETQVHQFDQEQSDAPRERSLRQLDESKRRRNETYVHQIDQEQSNTPRERSLKRQLDESKERLESTRKRLKIALQSKRRLLKKVANLNSVIADLKGRNRGGAGGLEESQKPANGIQQLLKRHALKQQGDALPTEYSPELRSFALALHFYSPRAYNYMRQCFSDCLPHPRTIQKWYSSSEFLTTHVAQPSTENHVQ